MEPHNNCREYYFMTKIHLCCVRNYYCYTSINSLSPFNKLLLDYDYNCCPFVTKRGSMKLNKVITKFPGVVSLSTAKVSELNLLYYLLINSFSHYLSLSLFIFQLAFQFPFDLIFSNTKAIEVLGTFSVHSLYQALGVLKQIVY